MDYSIVRIRPAFKRLGISPSRGYVHIQAGLLPRPIKAGARASGLLAHEVDAVLHARAAGMDADGIRKLVAKLEVDRLKLAA
jgi:prophage regulatory protein